MYIVLYEMQPTTAWGAPKKGYVLRKTKEECIKFIEHLQESTSLSTLSSYEYGKYEKMS